MTACESEEGQHCQKKNGTWTAIPHPKTLRVVPIILAAVVSTVFASVSGRKTRTAAHIHVSTAVDCAGTISRALHVPLVLVLGVLKGESPSHRVKRRQVEVKNLIGTHVFLCQL